MIGYLQLTGVAHRQLLMARQAIFFYFAIFPERRFVRFFQHQKQSPFPLKNLHHLGRSDDDGGFREVLDVARHQIGIVL